MNTSNRFIDRLLRSSAQAVRPAIRTGLWILVITVPISLGVLLLKLTGLLHLIARLCEPLFAWFGLPGESALVFVTAGLVNIYASIAVIETLGLAYGAGVIIDHVERGRLSRNHTDILNYHIAVSHSLLEDTLLFVAIGASIGWITIPRVMLAGLVVWIKRGIDRLLLRDRGAVVP
jgi:spore maturation protein SpmB